MKKLSVFFCTACVALMMSFPAFADVISPGIPNITLHPSNFSIWGIIVSSIAAAAAFIWHLFSRKK